MITHRSFVPSSPTVRTLARKRRAFTILEMMVALAVFTVLLAAVFVPIKLAGDLSGVGTARANAQQAAAQGIRQIKSDLDKAIFILPNDRTKGITDQFPYSANKVLPADTLGYPYLRDSTGYTKPSAKDKSDGTSAPNACSATRFPAANAARLDLILPATSSTGSVNSRVRTGNVLVSYYARRRDMSRAFDPVENPVVLYRAQIPFQYFDPNGKPQSFPAWGLTMGPPYNADLSNNRFSTASCNARSLQWLTMNQYGEFDLTALAIPQVTTAATIPTSVPTFGSQQLVLPRDTVLLTPNAASDTTADPQQSMSLVPDTAFICSDSNKDGKLDTVNIQMSVGQYDENSINRRTIPTPTPGGPVSAAAAPHAALRPQVSRTLTATVFAPNIQ